MKVAALSHVGKVRTVNEDSVLVHEKSAPVYMLSLIHIFLTYTRIERRFTKQNDLR